ncbi:MAG: chemotaxis protein CheW [Clostridiales bacterium]|nr:chemotaxis protein CheW [Clostridiales bacterium]
MDSNKYFTFKVEEDYYALPVEMINQIIGIQSITSVPNQPNYLIGVINLRGMIIPIVDFRMRMNFDTKEYNDRTSIVITENGNVLVGFIVDEVTEVLEIEDKKISKQSDKKNRKENALIDGFYKTEDFIVKILNYTQITQH